MLLCQRIMSQNSTTWLEFPSISMSALLRVKPWQSPSVHPEPLFLLTGCPLQTRGLNSRCVGLQYSIGHHLNSIYSLLFPKGLPHKIFIPDLAEIFQQMLVWCNPPYLGLGASLCFYLAAWWTNKRTSKSSPQTGCTTYFGHCPTTDGLCR